MWQFVHSYLHWQAPDGSRIEGRPLLRVFRGRCPTLLEQMPRMVHDPRDPEDMLKVDYDADKDDGGDDAVDALGYLVMCAVSPADTPAEPIVEGSLEWWTRLPIHGKGQISVPRVRP